MTKAEFLNPCPTRYTKKLWQKRAVAWTQQ